jgi:hypothetical protein
MGERAYYKRLLISFFKKNYYLDLMYLVSKCPKGRQYGRHHIKNMVNQTMYQQITVGIQIISTYNTQTCPTQKNIPETPPLNPRFPQRNNNSLP